MRLSAGLSGERLERPIGTWDSRTSAIEVGGFIVTTLLTDHSAPDAYVLLIEGGGAADRGPYCLFARVASHCPGQRRADAFGVWFCAVRNWAGKRLSVTCEEPLVASQRRGKVAQDEARLSLGAPRQ